MTSRSISNSRTCGARNARSFKFSMFSRSSRRSMLARDFNARLTEHHGVTSFCVCNLILSGYRGLSCFAEHSPGRVSDVFQTSTPALVSSQALFAVLKRSWRALQCPTKVLKDLTK